MSMQYYLRNEMTATALNQIPAITVQHPLARRWVARFTRYIDSRGDQKRRRLSRRQLAAMDPHLLKDANISLTQRFYAINKPFWE